MKKIYALVIILTTSYCMASAQGIYQFWGTTSQGMEANAGTLFSTKPDGTGHKIRPAFTYPVSGRAASAQVPVAFNNKLYGTIRYGGMQDKGLIYEYDPATGIYKKVFDLFYVGGDRPQGSLVLHNGKMYGMTADGGDNDYGVLFEFDPVTYACVKKKGFNIGSSPFGELTWFNSKFYGLLRFTGATGDGGLFEYDPATNVMNYKMDFSEATGKNPAGSLVAYNNLLWGTTHEGGVHNKGTIFCYNPATNAYTKKFDFNWANGSHSDKDFVLFNNKFYGLTMSGGANSKGVLFEYDPLTNTYTKKIDLDNTTGSHARGNMTVYNGKLYGTIGSGGAYSGGVLFEYNPANNVFIKKIDLDENTGTNPWGGLYVYNNKMYGLTGSGGIRGNGTFFEYNPAANSLVKKVEFGSLDGIKPEGYLAYYNNKIYGVTTSGGENWKGTVYQYDLATHTYTVIKQLDGTTGHANSNGVNGLVVHNSKIYGVFSFGGANDKGTLFEVNPANNVFTKLYDFTDASGAHPRGTLTAFNGKLYGGTLLAGSVHNMGTIFEFDPANNTLAPRVVMDASKGAEPDGAMVLYNNKLYGTCFEGGAHNGGTLFEYNPLANGFIKKFDFDGATHGRDVRARLTLVNNKIYGVADGGTFNHGVLFEYTPGAATVNVRYYFPDGDNVNLPYGSFTEHDNKLYALSNGGEGAGSRGALYEFDPVQGTVSSKINFFVTNGAAPYVTQLLKIPAVVAPGDASGNCAIASGMIDNTNNNVWVPFTNENGDAVAEIKANGNNLGRVLIKYYVHHGATRKDGNGNIYLNRNMSIDVDNQPTSPVSIRLYVRKTEFNALKATPNSGLFTHGQLQIFKNNDACGNAVIGAANPVNTTPDAWGADYVYVADVSSFSSFYFAKNTVGVLPVTLVSFTGNKEGAVNKLKWNANCTGSVNFTIERSADGVNYSPVGLVLAQQQDCQLPFSFTDVNVVAHRYYYRLHIKEDGGAASYSQVVILDRSAIVRSNLELAPNPVTGTIVQLSVVTAEGGQARISITDLTGKTVQTKQVKTVAGLNYIPVETTNLPAGIYLVIFEGDRTRQTIKMIKQ